MVADRQDGSDAVRARFDYVIHDVRVALRHVRAAPWFSLLVIGMLTAGIGANAAIFSAVNSLFLRPLPFSASDRLVDLDETAPLWHLARVGVSGPDLYDWRTRNRTFDSMAFFRGQSYNLADRGTAQRVQGAQVTREMLDVLRLAPAMGRNFRPDEDAPGGANVVLLTDALWQRLFGRDPDILGRVLKLDEVPYSVIGVLPPEAVFPDAAELWTPLAADPIKNTGYYVNGIGRLGPDVSTEQGQADLLRVHKSGISPRRVNAITSPIVTPLRDRYLGDLKTVGVVLLGAVAVVLLIACINIAALTMVRGAGRAREIAIRTAIGASQARVIAQLLIETLVLAVIGSVLGVLLGAAALRVMVARMPMDVPRWISFALDWRFALFCVAVASLAALLCGLTPAVQAARVDLRAVMQDAAARTTSSRGRRLTLGAFVVGEIALALMLLIAAGLIGLAFGKVLHIDPGFRPENVLTFRVSLPDALYERPARKVAYFETLLARLRAVPGIAAAGATSAPPLGGSWGGVFDADGARDIETHGEQPTMLQIAATPGYVEAMGMTLLEGRTFDDREGTPAAAGVAMVNEAFARHFWPRENPIGRRVRRLGGTDWLQVIGVLRDDRHDGLDQDVRPSIFLPYARTIATVDRPDARALREMSIVLRGVAEPTGLVNTVRDITRKLDPDAPMFGTETMTAQVDRTLWARRAYSWLFGTFAIIATLLAAAGLYGLVSYVVSQRTHEIGIRMALGARPGDVLRQVALSGMTLVSIGTAAGLTGALLVASLLRTLLFGVSAFDPIVYAAMVAGALGVGLIATLVPARRAARIAPLRALHFD